MAEEAVESSSSFESSGDSTVTNECLQELLDVFVTTVYKAKTTDRRYEIIQKRCLHFFGRDYRLEIIDNKQGQLCGHYPSEIIIAVGHLNTEHNNNDDPSSVNEVKEIKELMTTAKLARCRSRFVLPVILFENKNICRSATLSTTVELYGRSGVEWIFTGGKEDTVGGEDRQKSASTTPGGPTLNDPENSETEWALLSKVRGQDVRLMKALNVSLICDLMVEKKKLKFGVYVSSSEKVDKWARYSDFEIASMPYPGCEFFKDYKNNGYNPVSLQFDWKQSYIDAELCVPEIMKVAIPQPCISYQSWDLVLITQNYFKMLLKHLLECEGGLLVHCISGWDRTPLFVSWLRLSLWADGCIHNSLCAAEMLYLTLAYDWLMCGHQLKERHEKGEEVMYFCFDFLKYIVTEEFSIHGKPRSSKIPHNSTRALNGSTALTNSQEETTTTGKRLLSPLAFDDSVSTDELLSSSSSNSHPLSEENRARHVRGEAAGVCSSSHTSSNSRSGASCRLLRAQRLSEVRQLFFRVYRAAIPEVTDPPPAGNTLAGITGFFSRLAGSLNPNPAAV
ncbi:myotubularin-related protein 14-like isoform X3 [Halichondria panicea]|uniref:myotubularin-related protein 14-like isoform X3 n=1 Tax=Halichondria panicea TaxID=6063 RepID=UPI00312BB69D